MCDDCARAIEYEEDMQREAHEAEQHELERREWENREMEDHYRKYPNG